MQFNNPEQLEDFLNKPVGGNILIRPMTGSSFHAEINLKQLKHIDIFSIAANSFKVEKEPSTEYFGLTIPLKNSTVTVKDRQRENQYSAST